jgi:hypothetical protein
VAPLLLSPLLKWVVMFHHVEARSSAYPVATCCLAMVEELRFLLPLLAVGDMGGHPYLYDARMLE